MGINNTLSLLPFPQVNIEADPVLKGWPRFAFPSSLEPPLPLMRTQVTPVAFVHQGHPWLLCCPSISNAQCPFRMEESLASMDTWCQPMLPTWGPRTMSGHFFWLLWDTGGPCCSETPNTMHPRAGPGPGLPSSLPPVLPGHLEWSYEQLA